MRVEPRWILAILVVAVVLLHLFVNQRWGYHSDELYFIECGRHLAFGYVDHAPMVPWLAGLTCPAGECSLMALRFPSLVARALAVLLTGKLVWELGGGRFATLLAGLAMIIAPAFQRMGKILCIPVMEPVLWTACAIVLVYLIQGRSRKWWLALGVFAGIGLLTKHTMLIWGFAVFVGIVLTPFTLPILPLQQQDDALRAVLGSIVPPEALTHDLHGEHGWPEQAEAVAAVYAKLPAGERELAVVLTGRYGQASAINFFGPRHGLPSAVSGHMTYYLWGPSEAAGPVIAYGFSKERLLKYFGSVVQQGTIEHPLANARERGVPIYVCRDPVQPLGDVWTDFKRYRHANEPQ